MDREELRAAVSRPFTGLEDAAYEFGKYMLALSADEYHGGIWAGYNAWSEKDQMQDEMYIRVLLTYDDNLESLGGKPMAVSEWLRRSNDGDPDGLRRDIEQLELSLAKLRTELSKVEQTAP